MGVEFLEEVGGELGVLPDEGVKFVVGRCRGVDGQVGVSRHSLAMEDAEGVPAEGGVGLTMLEGGSLLGFAALSSLVRGWWLGGVDVVEVPRWGR